MDRLPMLGGGVGGSENISSSVLAMPVPIRCQGDMCGQV